MAGLAAFIVGIGTLAACASDTSKLKPGDCVKVDGIGYHFGGDAEKVSCGKVAPLSDFYRVRSFGTESEMDRICRMPDLEIADEGDAACLTQ
jgi:hypothetical protein